MATRAITKDELENAFLSWVGGIKHHDQNTLSALISSDLKYNGRPVDKKEYLASLLTATANTEDIAVDMLIASSQNPDVAARLIHHSRQGRQHPEYVFLHFSPSSSPAEKPQITSLHSLSDEASDSPVPRSPPRAENLSSDPPSTTTTATVDDLPTFYHAYIDSINTLTMAEHFPRFCQPQVTHNTRVLDIAPYYSFIESSFEDIRGLHFNVVDLVADEGTQQVASRIEFTGRPVRTFRGVEPGANGEEVKFWEHAFYFLEEGKIARVWSVLDMDAYKRCLGRDTVGGK